MGTNKMKVALCVVLLFGAVFSLSTEDQFKDWMVKYEKTYTSDADYLHALKNFEATLRRVDTLNSDPQDTAVYGLGPFSDLSPLEFRNAYLMKDYTPAEPVDEIVTTKFGAAPQTFDWRSKSGIVSPVKNQGQCGSCWAFSTVEAVESAWAMANHSMTILSPQQIVDCDTRDNGCGGGNPPTAYDYIMQAGGLETNADYPYTARNGECKADKSKEVVDITGFKYSTRSRNEHEMIDSSYAVGPLSVCVSTGGWQDYQSGIMTKLRCGFMVDHCVGITGWDLSASKPYWVVRNSWGTSWGNDGYIYVEFGHDVCEIAGEATYPTV